MAMLTNQPVDLVQYFPAGTDQRLTVDDTAGGVQFSAFDQSATHVFWTAEAAESRFTIDASAPTTTNGHIVSVGDCGLWPLAWALAAKFIKTGATDAVLHASPLKIVR